MEFARIDTSRKADINYIVGSSGAGKSFYIKQAVADEKRLLVFDPDDEYGDIPGIITTTNGKQLTELIKAHATKPLKVRLVRNGVDAFELCNALAFAWTNCTYVAEEIADVTRVGKAPPAWGQTLRRGRKRGIRIFITTQRPAEADKTAFTQASMVRTGLLGNIADQDAMRRSLDIPLELLRQLGPLDFIECHRNAKRQVFIGNAAAGIREEITEKVRSGGGGLALTEQGAKSVQTAPKAPKKPNARALKPKQTAGN